MTSASPISFHTVDSEWLGAYSSGAISEAKRLVLNCQIAMKAELASQMERIDAVGGHFIETANGEPLSAEFSRKLDRAIESASISTSNELAEEQVSDKENDWAPAPLKTFLDESEINLVWRKCGPGIERATLFEDGEERVYLLKAQPGLKLPSHSHSGQEWTLVLQGGYHVGGKGYARGDLHSEDENCTHQPVIDNDGEACISLVVDEGRLVFSNPVLKLLQPILKI